MEDELLGIGRVSARSGLPVSALRFYDGAGVLTPAVVHPVTGYRYYRPDQVAQARVIAHLRRIGLPLTGIRAVLADRAATRPILDAHLARLEAGLAEARREISIVHHLLDRQEIPMIRCTLPAADLVRALRQVRYAVCESADEPRLSGVFLDSEGELLRVVATDRYRMATSTVRLAAPVSLSLLLPTAAVDEVLAGGDRGLLELVVSDGEVTVTGPDGTVRASIPDVDFPSYRPWLDARPREVRIDAPALRESLNNSATQDFSGDGKTYDVSRLAVTASGVDVIAPGAQPDDADALVIGVNRDFLLQAIDGADQLVLGFDEPIAPLAIRHPDPYGALSVLMPVRLDQPA